MTLTAPAPSTPRSERGGGALVVAALGAAVLATVALVATPRASTGAASAASLGLPSGTTVEVRGGDPLVAYDLADRLGDAGATVGPVRPSASPDGVEAVTTVVYYDRRSLAAAAHVRELLGGTGTLRRQQVFEPPADVTIVLGKDLPHL